MGQESKRLEEILEGEPKRLRLSRSDIREVKKMAPDSHRTIELTVSEALYRSLLGMNKEQMAHVEKIAHKLLPPGFELEDGADWSDDDAVMHMYQIAMMKYYDELCENTEIITNIKV